MTDFIHTQNPESTLMGSSNYAFKQTKNHLLSVSFLAEENHPYEDAESDDRDGGDHSDSLRWLEQKEKPT